MCRTVHALLSTGICGIQMLVRVFMTIILMLENLIRMILQTLYNFISFMLQMISLIPICVVFLATARLKCFMCGGGGPCPVNRGGACDCLMSAAALVILFFIFRATGVLDKIFYKIGYVQAPPVALVRFAPTPGDITECSRNDTDTVPAVTTKLMKRYFDYETEIETEELDSTSELTTALKITSATVLKPKRTYPSRKAFNGTLRLFLGQNVRSTPTPTASLTGQLVDTTTQKAVTPSIEDSGDGTNTFPSNLTTVIYYLV